MKKYIGIFIFCLVIVNFLAPGAKASPLWFCENNAGQMQLVGYESSQIIVNLPAYHLYFSPQQILEKEYPIAIGSTSSPTPIFSWNGVIEREINPSYYSVDGKTIIEGGLSYNPLGRRWIRLYKNIGLHGNSSETSIGKSVSQGCMRMHNYDVEELFARTSYSTSGQTVYEPIEVWERASGVYIKIYPDVYNYGYKYQQELNEIFSSLQKNGRELIVSPYEIPIGLKIPKVIKIAE